MRPKNQSLIEISLKNKINARNSQKCAIFGKILLKIWKNTRTLENSQKNLQFFKNSWLREYFVEGILWFPLNDICPLSLSREYFGLPWTMLVLCRQPLQYFETWNAIMWNEMTLNMREHWKWGNILNETFPLSAATLPEIFGRLECHNERVKKTRLTAASRNGGEE